MKKKIIAVILGLILCLSMTACGGDNYSAVQVNGKQDTSYAVLGNGGNAVQYGNYIYFINGYRGYTDSDATANVWGNVIKGGLYRAELKGDKVDGMPFNGFDAVGGNDAFTTRKVLGLDQNAVDEIDVQAIAPKTVGTSGFAGGGIFIFDDYVYYASPNNQKDKSGTVQTGKTDFFRTALDGSKTQKLFTTDADTSSSPYGFYKYGGNMYVVVLDGTSLKSIKVGPRKCEITEIASGVESAVFPVKDKYYQGMPENGVEDFVYVSRTAGAGDNQRAGSVLEAIRPDGSERGIFWEDGTTASIDGVRDGLVYFRSVVNGTDTAIRYSNLHNFFMGVYEAKDKNGNVTGDEYLFPSYANAEDTKGRENVEGIALQQTTSTVTGYTYVYAMRPDARNVNDVRVVTATSAGIFLYTQSASIQVYAGEADVKAVKDNYVYFADKDGAILYRTNVYTAAADKDEEAKKETLTEDTVAGTYGMDICAGYLVYFANVDENYTAYTHFYELDGLAGREATFVGKLAASDAPAASTDTSTEE